MSTVSGAALSGLHDQAMRAVGPQLQDMLATKDLMELAVRAVGPQLQDMLAAKDLIEQIDWDAALSSSEVQQILGAAPRILVPHSPEVQQKMDQAVGTQLGGIGQPTSAEVIAARTLFFTIVGVIVMILALIVSVVVAVHEWRAPKATSPVINQEIHVTIRRSM